MFKLFAKKDKKPKATFRGPQYIYRPMENALSYRVEHRDSVRYVYPGWSKSFLFKIEEGKIYRAGEDEPYYIIIGKGIYEPDGEKLVYKLMSDAIYRSNSREPEFVIKNSINVQGTI